MFVVHVHISVKLECLAAFREATVANARESVKEPGIARFDFSEQIDAPGKFMIVEAYRSSDAPARHKETKHYQVWRDAVAPMTAEPRVSVKYSNIFPTDENW